MARFSGVTKSEFIDNRQEHGNIFELMRHAQNFLRSHLPVAGKISANSFERDDVPLYPTEALREALANAFCHRDYAVQGGAVSLSIFDDRLEISNPGKLPPGMDVADLTLPHSSRPTNPLIANVLFRRGVIESWGRGTNRIVDLTTQAGLRLE